jgi:hypothetical protein
VRKVVVTADAIHGTDRPQLIAENGQRLDWESVSPLQLPLTGGDTSASHEQPAA